MLAEILRSDPEITVVGVALNGQEALEQVRALRPDLVTMDVEMPVMGGLEAIERIMAEHPLPILVVTGLGTAATAFPAISRGALDVIAKPDATAKSREEFLLKVRQVAAVDVKAGLLLGGPKQVEKPEPATAFHPLPGRERVVAIAASTGGPQALQVILSGLPAGFPAPIVIAQHIGDGFARGMVEWLGRSALLKVMMATDGASLEAGTVLINPAESRMSVDAGGSVSLSPRDPDLLYRPSCDHLLRSVAAAYKDRAVGLILSGMGDDGVDGMAAIHRSGGRTLAQDADTSVVYGMNRMAVEKGCIQEVLSLDRLPTALTALAALAERE